MPEVRETPRPEGAGPGAASESSLRVFVRRFARNRVAVAAVVVFVLVALLAIFAPWLTPWDRDAPNLALHDHAPGQGHLLGTDGLGRDELTRLLWGGRVSLLVGVASTLISVVIGIVVGSAAGFFGGWLDNVLMRVVDVFISLPQLAFLIVVAAILGPSVWHTILVIGVLGWTGVARIVRGEILSLREREYVEAARALGAKSFSIVMRHLLPNAMAPVIVSATLGVAGNVILEASLSFLGLGVQEPIPSWGNMLQAATNYRVLVLYWWEWIPPGMMIFLTTLSIYLVGDAIRDAWDPRLK
ncbi:MAG: ABC transporter permease [Clostridia bacterium]|nr:ABC transporter permease [Clostridia bacterium]